MKKTLVRPDSSGEIDDIFVECDSAHFERMGSNQCWLGLQRGGKAITFSISGTGAVRVSLVDDELGAMDDTGKGKPRKYKPGVTRR